MWAVIQCGRYECAKFLVSAATNKTRKCPYCRKSNKVADRLIRVFESQEDARDFAKRKNTIVP